MKSVHSLLILIAVLFTFASCNHPKEKDLFKAVQNNDIKSIAYAIENNIDIKVLDKDKSSLLMIASAKGNDKLIQLLLGKRINNQKLLSLLKSAN